ncbi:MAG: inverse autotransporter beta domain-containing protein [Chlamydiia bacterium]|nr:inverse autotransporter beta domain-containing protein [Chlamydiia bacterium]
MNTRVFALSLLTCAFLFADDCVHGPSCRFSVGTRQGKGIGYDEGYSSLDGFLTPNWQKPFQPFLDGRVHMFNNSRFAGNLGMGFRLMALENWAFGINGFYDFRSEKSLSPHQMGMGLEALNYNVDFRFNLYIPVAETERRGPARLVGLENNVAIVSRRLSAAYGGMNAEVGFPIRGFFEPINLYLGLDPYYLFRKEVAGFNFGNSFGGLARLNMRILDCVDIGGSFSYDRLFHGRINGYINLSIPFSPSTLIYKGKRWNERYHNPGCSGQASRQRLLTQPVIRREIIPMKQTKLTALGQDPVTHKSLSLVFVDNSMTWPGAGTFEAPFHSLALAEQHSKPGQTIYILPGDGTSRHLDSGIALKPGQRLHGPGTDLLIDDTFYPATLKKVPTLTNPHGAVVTFSDNNQVRGINIEQNQGSGIDARQASHFVISNVNLIGCGVDATASPSGVKHFESNHFLGAGIAVNDVDESRVAIRQNTIEGASVGVAFGGASCFTIVENDLRQVEKGLMGELKSGQGFFALQRNKIDTLGTAIGFLSTSMDAPAQLLIEENTIKGRDHFDDALLLLAGTKDAPGLIEAFIQKNNLFFADIIIKVQNTESHIKLKLLDNQMSGRLALINFSKNPAAFEIESLNLDVSGISDLNNDGDVLIPFEPVAFLKIEDGPRFFTPFKDVEEE